MTITADRRYAEALLDSVWQEDEASRSKVAADLGRFAQAIRDNPDLRNALENPSYSSEERLKVVDAVARRFELSEKVQRFVRLVVDRGRASEIEDMATTFDRLLDARVGRVKARVTSAAPLDEDAAEAIRAALQKRTGKKVEMDLRVDPELIGGVRAEVGSIVYDGSIRAELDRLRERMTAD